MGVVNRIDRIAKNAMRSQLEEVLHLHRDIDKKIIDYRRQTKTSEYLKFWDELKRKNDENIKVVSRFMVLKCNR